MSLTVEIIRQEFRFRELEPEWAPLIPHRWTIPIPKRRLCVLLARDEDGSVVGMAPMEIGKGDDLPRRWMRCLRFLSGFEQFFCVEGRESEVLRLFYEVFSGDLKKDWDLLRLIKTDANAPFLPELMRVVPQLGGLTVRVSPDLVEIPNMSSNRTFFFEQLRIIQGLIFPSSVATLPPPPAPEVIS